MPDNRGRSFNAVWIEELNQPRREGKSAVADFSLAKGNSRDCDPLVYQAAFLLCLSFAHRAFWASEILRRPAAESTRFARCEAPTLDVMPEPRVSFSRTEIASPSFWTWFCASRRSSRSRSSALAMLVIQSTPSGNCRRPLYYSIRCPAIIITCKISITSRMFPEW